MFGKLIAAPFRLLNIPLDLIEEAVDAVDKGMGGEGVAKNTITRPLEKIAEKVEEAVDGDN